jgi:hypothetical protein|tara:strand:- start:108 stop:569 length:462 start_codon:yes stop_codon:yes gene_type:complete
MKSITILLLIFTTTCSSQTTFKSIQNDIVELYIFKNEVQEENREKILGNFKELITITDLIKTSNFSYGKVGIYKVSPNITHTTTNLLILNKDSYKVLSIDDDFSKTFNELSTFLKNDTSINKEETIQYFESFFNIVKENRGMKGINTLENIDD